jgi:hypothetical protein
MAVNQPPHLSVWILILERGGQAMRTHIVKALEHRKSP